MKHGVINDQHTNEELRGLEVELLDTFIDHNSVEKHEVVANTPTNKPGQFAKQKYIISPQFITWND